MQFHWVAAGKLAQAALDPLHMPLQANFRNPAVERACGTCGTAAIHGAIVYACRTQQEIAEAVGVSKAEVNNVCSQMADLPNLNKPATSHLVDFDPPLYNVWKLGKTADSPPGIGVNRYPC